MPKYVAGALLLLIAVGSLLPGTLRIPSPFLTTTEHFLAYAFATFVIVATVKRRWLGMVAIPSMASLACVFEVIQISVPGRRGDWDDVVFGIAGVAIGGFFAYLVRASHWAWLRLRDRAEPIRWGQGDEKS